MAAPVCYYLVIRNKVVMAYQSRVRAVDAATKQGGSAYVRVITTNRQGKEVVTHIQPNDC